MDINNAWRSRKSGPDQRSLDQWRADRALRGHILGSRDRGSHWAIWNSSTVTTESVPSNAKPKPNLRPSRQRREKEVPLQAPCSARGGALWGSVPCRCAGTGDVLGLAWLGLAWLGLIRRGRRRRSLLQLGHVTYRDAAPATAPAPASKEYDARAIA